MIPPFMTLLPPDDFTNPYEAAIIKLEHQYLQGIREGKMLEELKPLKVKIRTLKAEN